MYRGAGTGTAGGTRSGTPGGAAGERPRLFVEYRFLDVPPEQLESPHSLPLPEPGEPLVFNFRKGEVRGREGGNRAGRGQLVWGKLGLLGGRAGEDGRVLVWGYLGVCGMLGLVRGSAMRRRVWRGVVLIVSVK